VIPLAALDLPDTLTICASVGLLVGGFIGVLVHAPSGRRMLDNAIYGMGVGTFGGTRVGFALWFATVLSEAAK
jgi:hypothetical protein